MLAPESVLSPRPERASRTASPRERAEPLARALPAARVMFPWNSLRGTGWAAESESKYEREHC